MRRPRIACRPRAARVLVPVVAAALAGCGGGGGRESEANPPGETTDAATTSAAPATSEPVTFQAEDGRALVGRLWGDGSVGVVLAHGFSQGVAQETWLSFAEFLADRRYRVLTFNFRGFCNGESCSEGSTEVGNNWLDAVAAVRFLEAGGAEQIVLVGASMGGLAVLRAARTPGIDVAGVVSLATPQFPSRYYPAFGEPEANDVTPARLRQIDEPKLFIAGVDDVQTRNEIPLGPGVERVRFAADAERMFSAAAEPKELVLVDSSFHSSDLVTQAEDEIVDETRAEILRFIEEHTG